MYSYTISNPFKIAKLMDSLKLSLTIKSGLKPLPSLGRIKITEDRRDMLYQWRTGLEGRQALIREKRRRRI
jgi:hypothetical protein|tara:strand:- start:262 stop:474 length:213 start_codon:yes stop_codon:yes gene_type:complete